MISMDQLIDILLEERPLPAEPINYYYDGDPAVPIGSTWVDRPYVRDNNELRVSRRRSLAGWTIGNLLNGGMHIREKLTLFWSNHFVTQGSVVRDPNFIYYNNNLLRAGALGNFRTLVERVTVNPAMLRYLNGNQNTRNSPNENYARELMELFTIGKGTLAAPGDYTTFTEQDVTEGAKILTGWIDTGFYYRDNQPAGSRFIANRHDRSTKQLSHRFNNAVVTNQNSSEYKFLIDIILQQDEVARFICRKLYRWFVYYDITDEVESLIIEPMAKIFRDNDYEVRPVLRALLSSRHFYNICSVGPMIKNPIDFIINHFVQFEIPVPEGIIESYQIWSRLSAVFEGFGMVYYEPPDVAGWKAYYQEPLYYRTWITAATLPLRQAFTNIMISGQAKIRDIILTMDPLNMIAQLDNPYSPDALIEELASYIYPVSLTPAQVAFLKEVLIPGLPDFEWTVEYNLHLSNPEDEATRRSVDAKLRVLLTTMLAMPEYYLS